MRAAFSPPRLNAPVLLRLDFDPVSKSGSQSSIPIPIPIPIWILSG
jgi:hypothetical protein